MKTCKQCDKKYPATAEYFDRNGKYLRTVCKTCKANQAKKYKGRYSERKKEYREQNKDHIRAYQKRRYRDNREKLLEQSQQRYQRNAMKICERTNRYRENNKERYREYRRAWQKRNRLICSVRRGIWGCLAGKQKSCRSAEYLGCSVEELWNHLESLFREGMTRENYGEWHVDHIRPLSSWDFNVDTESKLYEAWHYTNLQPLWAKENLSKGNSWKSKK